MSMRLIDADLAPIYLNDAACEQIKSMPTIDAVPVVRCEDCKYWDYGACYRLELSRPDDFCSYGELREKIE